MLLKLRDEQSESVSKCIKIIRLKFNTNYWFEKTKNIKSNMTEFDHLENYILPTHVKSN